jgi:Fe-Mn family superoxide dismutase
LIKWTEFENMKLEKIIMKSSGWIFNNAAQVWNHTFYWNGLIPNWSEIWWEIKKAIDAKRLSLEKFKTEFADSAIWNFGSGWTWLVKNSEWKLEIVNTSNADTPMTHWLTAVLTIDVREHAYYLKYQNRRLEYLENWFNLIDWNKVEELYNK